MAGKRSCYMKKYLCIAVLVVGLAGCTTNQQTVAGKTLYGLEVATTGAYDGYDKAVIAGNVPTNDVPKISHAYNDFQAAMVVAILAAQNNTNALAPANLANESAAVINLITTVTGGH